MFEIVLDKHKNGIIILDEDFKVHYSNNVLKKIFKNHQDKRCGEFLECIHQKSSKKRCLETKRCSTCNMRKNISRVLEGEIKEIYIDNIEYQALINNQKEKISMNIELKRIEKDGKKFVIIEFFKMKTKNDVLISDERILDGVLDNLGDYIFYKNKHGKYVYANKAFCNYIGIKKIDLIGRTDEELFPDKLVKCWAEGDNKALTLGKHVSEDKFSRRYFKVTKQRVDLENETLLVCVTRDITHEKQELKKAYLDGLTGVGNRYGYDKKIRKIFKSKKQNYSLALLDLDFLREINNELGHTSGDVALKSVAKIIKEAGMTDIYRIGGDEFAFLIDEKSDSLEICQQINAKIKTVKIEDRYLSASIGIIELKYDESIINNFNSADEALYESKKMGRGMVTKR